MKVYVDELPKNCKVCPCLHDEEMCIYCNLDVFDGNNCPYRTLNKERHQDCPLRLIADYTKHVRKDVCEEIRNQAFLQEYRPYGETDKVIDMKVIDMVDLLEILDQIQGE